MKKLRIFLGLSDSQGEIIDMYHFRELTKEVVSIAGGASIIDSVGYYTNNEGTLITEVSKIIEVTLTDDNKDETILEKVKEFLKATKQEAALVEQYTKHSFNEYFLYA
jgi:hypothetical protein